MNGLQPEAARLGETRNFRYVHTVSFEETNVVGNVYFSRYVAWQGRCREMFLKKHAPAVMEEFERGLKLVTLSVACEYFAELHALDDVEICMTLAYIRQHRIGMLFHYYFDDRGQERPIARGSQEIGCMRVTSGTLVPCPPPLVLSTALEHFRQESNAPLGY